MICCVLTANSTGRDVDFTVKGIDLMNDPTQKGKSRAAALSIISNLILTTSKLLIGMTMFSVSVFSEAVHSGLDVVASIVAYISVKQAGRPPDGNHKFGHGKIECIAGIVEAVLIIAASAYILFESYEKLRTGRVEIQALGLGSAVMGFSAVANTLVSTYLFRIAKKSDSIALRADAMHLRTDVYTSAGVFAGLIAIKLTGKTILDPIIAIGIALLVLKAAFILSRDALNQILDATLPEHEEAIIRAALNDNAKLFVQYHKLRSRKSGNIRYIDLHLVVPSADSVQAGHDVGHQISEAIEERLPNSLVLVHVEPCNNRCNDCHLHCYPNFIE